MAIDITLAFELNENGLALFVDDTITSSIGAAVADPTITGVATAEGALYLRTNGLLYIKTGPLDTDWSIAATEDFVSSGFQPLDSDLTALAGIGTTGLYVITGTGTSVTRTITGTPNKITLTDGNGVAGNPTIDIAATYVGQTSITTLGTITTGTWNGTAIGATFGGTGQTVYAVGDILYADTTTTLAKLADVATGNAIISGGVGVAPLWGKIGLTTHVSGTLGIGNGGTGGTTATVAFNNLSPLTTKGDLIVHNGTNNVREPVTTNNFVLTVDSTTATGIKWAAVAGTILQLYNENPSTPTANTVAGTNSVAIGQGHTASGQDAIVLGGSTNTASSTYSSALGNRANARHYGENAQASARFATDGDGQTTVSTLYATTTTAATTEMFLDGAGGSQRMTLPNDSAWGFRILVVARRTDVNNEGAVYEFVGGIDRNATAATTALIAAVSKTVVAENTAAWDCNVNADTTNGSLRIQVNGVAASTINWVARVERVEVTG